MNENEEITDLPRQEIGEAEADASAENTFPEANDIPDETGSSDSTADSADSIDALKAEIMELRGMLQQQKDEIARKVRELEDFNRLFPSASISALPEAVSNMVGEGVPLAAAYALYEKELAAKAGRAGEINRKNASLSAGRAGTDTAGEFFTPDEVRAMSRRQVHENYAKIRESMKHWRNKTFY